MLWLLLVACGSGDVFIVRGTVVSVDPPDQVVLDHEAIEGLKMPAMVMPFNVAESALLEGLSPGTRVVARYAVAEQGSRLVKVRITGQGPPPVVQDTGPVPARVGEPLVATEVVDAAGRTIKLGPGQGGSLALTFVYTRCPLPEYCPAMIGRLLALDQALEGVAADLVLVTLDPDHDTPEVLSAYASAHAEGDRFRFARAASNEALADLAMQAGLLVMREGDTISHALRLLVLDTDGRLVERYDDARFPLERVVAQLQTGKPQGDPSQSGTTTPP